MIVPHPKVHFCGEQTWQSESNRNMKKKTVNYCSKSSTERVHMMPSMKDDFYPKHRAKANVFIVTSFFFFFTHFF